MWKDSPLGLHTIGIKKRIGITRSRKIGFIGRINFDPIIHQLKEILVVGGDHHFSSLVGRLQCISGNQIVGFSIRQAETLESEERHEMSLDVIELRAHLVGHLIALLFVFGLKRGAAFRQSHIPDDRTQIGLKILYHSPKRFSKAVDRIGRFAS